MSTLLMRGGRVHTGRVHTGRPGERPGPTAVALEDDRVVFVGSDDRAAAYEDADEVVDLDGALVAPAFVDAHVHTVATGFLLTRLDLRSARSLADALDQVARYAGAASAGGEVVVGNGWDETTWPEHRPPTGAELERLAPGVPVFLDRRDSHSSVVSPALAARVPSLTGLVGWSESGRVERDARHAVCDALADLVGPEQRLAAARAAVAEMAAHGVAAFHENAAPHIGPEYELALVRQAAEEAGLVATLYWGELDAYDKARELGVAGLAGDLNADGAVGSRTASMRSPYADDATCGHGYLDAAQVADHVVGCTGRGLQAGFHCIGDAALDAVTEGFRAAEKQLGAPALRAARHRLEHVEMPSADTLAMLADLEVTASVQPLFDALWGGPDRMYAERLGDRWRTMNPFAALRGPVAFGSDAPVTSIRPWEAVRAAVLHRTPEQRISPAEAFAHHSRGGWRAARSDEAGTVHPGAPAHLALWDCPEGLDATSLPLLADDAALPGLRRLVVAGRTVHEEGR